MAVSPKSYEFDCVAKAFGFQSAAHLGAVLAGTAPSALQDDASRTHDALAATHRRAKRIRQITRKKAA